MFAAALTELVASLVAVGIPAAIDPRNVNPPAVMVRGDALEPARGKLCGTETLRFSLLLIVPDIGDPGAYDALDALYGAVMGVPGLSLTTDDRVFERTILPDAPTALPTLRLTGDTMIAAPTPTRTLERTARHA